MRKRSWLVALVVGWVMSGCYVEQPAGDDDDDGGSSAGSSEQLEGPADCALHTDCPAGTLCHFEATTCGQVGGTCQPANGAADAVAPTCPVTGPVCGCDGINYASACAAWDFGVSIWFEGTCEQGPPAEPDPATEPQPDPGPTDACGGCGDSQFCYFADNSCGAYGGGECRDPNGVCTSPMQTVCGCDGMTYPSECEAIRNSTSVAHMGAC